jgi:hypothetical protein
MTIYVTQYKASGEFLSKSVDSGFKDLNHVKKVMGSEYLSRGKRFIIYEQNGNRGIFSDYKFN